MNPEELAAIRYRLSRGGDVTWAEAEALLDRVEELEAAVAAARADDTREWRCDQCGVYVVGLKGHICTNALGGAS